MIYQFDIYGTVENKELTRFARFVESKYHSLTSENINIQFNGIVAIAQLDTARKLPPAKLEKCRFLLETEFKKHFEKVRCVAYLLPANPKK